MQEDEDFHYTCTTGSRVRDESECKVASMHNTTRHTASSCTAAIIVVSVTKLTPHALL